MFNTTTELQNIGSTSITTPEIRLKMRENLNFTTSVPFSRMMRVWDAITFQNQYILYGLTATTGITYIGRLETWSLDGLTMFSATSINNRNGASLISNTQGSLEVTGDTVGFFYTDTSGLTSVIRCIFSGDGQAWGGSEVVFVGNSSHIVDLVAIGPTRIYTLRFVDVLLGVTNKPDNFSYGGQNLVTIDVHKKTGSWGVTSTISGKFYLPFGSFPASVSHHILGSQIDDSTDRLILKYSTNSNESTSSLTSNLRVFTLDQTMTYGNFDLISEDKISEDIEFGDILITNLAKHNNTFFFGFKALKYDFRLDAGITKNFVYQAPLAIIKSNDLQNWSTPIFINGVTRRIANLDGNIGALASGITSELLLNWFGVSHGVSNATTVIQSEQNILMYQGVSELDISNQLIRYRNNNNERINITLGNYE